MRILMLAHRIPYPPYTGDKTRAYHIARYLARRHSLTLAFLVDDRADLAGVDVLREVVATVEFAKTWKPWSLLKGVTAMAVGGSLSLPYFSSGRLKQRLANRIAQGGYDLVYASSSPMAQYARALGLPVVMDFVDVDSDKWVQYGDHSRAPLSWLYRTEGRRLQAAEADIARWAALCLLATPTEEALLQSFAPWARTAVIPNGIDLDYFRPVERSASVPAVIFTGAMDYLPNVDAVRYFCDEVLPRVRREVPDTRFYIVGLNPTPEVRRLGGLPGVTVTGTVPDVRPYYARATVCVAPLRIGRGVQNKVLQAMSVGMPVVASSVAQRGLQAEPSKHLHVEDDPVLFASRVVQLLNSPDERLAIGRRARGFVEAHHAWDVSCARLDRLISATAAGASAGVGVSA
ncbi:MAG TPA: TIGR03087 family PEP-CTERM/XrtA system glycosyltransferase [Methylomirabilota bacterium]|nr:TIGR03087 family PEP-CTERM/XrtA system glycosyltransferase [Methylomirabilota bacterium]